MQPISRIEQAIASGASPEEIQALTKAEAQNANNDARALLADSDRIVADLYNRLERKVRAYQDAGGIVLERIGSEKVRVRTIEGEKSVMVVYEYPYEDGCTLYNFNGEVSVGTSLSPSRDAAVWWKAPPNNPRRPMRLSVMETFKADLVREQLEKS